MSAFGVKRTCVRRRERRKPPTKAAPHFATRITEDQLPPRFWSRCNWKRIFGSGSVPSSCPSHPYSSCACWGWEAYASEPFTLALCAVLASAGVVIKAATLRAAERSLSLPEVMLHLFISSRVGRLALYVSGLLRCTIHLAVTLICCYFIIS